jgi:hypothetical protein
VGRQDMLYERGTSITLKVVGEDEGKLKIKSQKSKPQSKNEKQGRGKHLS